MSNVRLTSRGIRLHPALWARIDREAKRLRLKPTDFLRRTVEDAFSFDPDVQETHGKGRESNVRDDSLVSLPE